MNLRSSSLRRSVMLAIFGVALWGFGSIAANAQHRSNGHGRQNVRQDRHHDRRVYQQPVRQPVYYGNSGYNNNGYYNDGYYNNNNGYYNNNRNNQRRPVYRSSGLGSLLRVVIGGGNRNRRHH